MKKKNLLKTAVFSVLIVGGFFTIGTAVLSLLLGGNKIDTSQITAGVIVSGPATAEKVPENATLKFTALKSGESLTVPQNCISADAIKRYNYTAQWQKQATCGDLYMSVTVFGEKYSKATQAYSDALRFHDAVEETEDEIEDILNLSGFPAMGFVFIGDDTKKPLPGIKPLSIMCVKEDKSGQVVSGAVLSGTLKVFDNIPTVEVTSATLTLINKLNKKWDAMASAGKPVPMLAVISGALSDFAPLEVHVALMSDQARKDAGIPDSLFKKISLEPDTSRGQKDCSSALFSIGKSVYPGVPSNLPPLRPYKVYYRNGVVRTCLPGDDTYVVQMLKNYLLYKQYFLAGRHNTYYSSAKFASKALDTLEANNPSCF